MYSSDQKKGKLLIQNVEITPEALEFTDPCEGSTYKKTICIQNIGHSSIFIKICQPSSCAYTIKGTYRGQYLSPGLSIVKVVSFTYSYMSSHVSKLPIFIGKERYEYELRVITPKPVIKYDPDCIDFGVLDSGFTSTNRCLHLRNEGSKAIRFAVDIGRNDPQLIIEPHKGILQPRSSVDINLKLIAFKEGKLMPDIWIICESPIRIPLKGNVIVPKLVAIHPNATTNFTFLDFKTTYIGVQNVQVFLVKNSSSHRTMFCVMGLINNQAMSLKAAEECDCNFKHFKVFPKDGQLEPKETRVIYFTFCPLKISRSDRSPARRRYNFCGFQICRVPCKDLDRNDYVGSIFKNERPVIQRNTALSMGSLITSVNASLDYDSAQSLSHFPPTTNTTYLFEDHKSVITVYLHGVPRTAAVEVVPTEITLSDLHLGQQEKHVLKFKNMSKELPVILRYKKVTFIDLEKKNAFLKPSEELEVLVSITPHVIGTVNTNMKFDLLFYDNPKTNDEYKVVGHVTVPVVMSILAGAAKKPGPKLNNGLAPNYVKEVGMFCDKITFDSHVVRMPKCAVLKARLEAGGDDLIAFPNDTQCSVRPWRNDKTCKTIFTGIPRYTAPCDTDYELTPFDQQLKNEVNNYYTEYARKEAEKLKQLKRKITPQAEDYDLTNEKLLLCTDIPCLKTCKLRRDKIPEDDYFLPLTPSELSQILVSPQIVATGKIAAHCSYEFKVLVRNKSANSIELFIKSNEGCILFSSGDRKIVKANSEFEVTLIYLSQSVGFYTVSIDFIVNGSSVFSVTVIAEVVLKSLKLNTSRLEFESDELHKYIDIYNPLNANIPFRWNTEQQSNFLIEPTQGVVEPNSHVTCCVTYLEYQSIPSVGEVDFISGDKSTQPVQLVTKNRQENCFFVQNIVTFENIPLNVLIQRKAILRNATSTPYFFRILNPDVLDGISIFPTSAVIKANSEWILYVTAKIRSCVKFSCLVKIEVTKTKFLELYLRGNVVYPEIKITPTLAQLKRIPSSSFDSLNFTLENSSSAEATIWFDFSQHHEFHISESKQPWMPAVQEKITLAVNSSIHLVLHFSPSDVSIGSFYLPIIINDIIGPPINTDLITTKVEFYISTYLANSTPIKIPSHLCCVNIQRRTIEPKVKFSKTYLKFTCSPWDKKNDSSYTLTIVNTQKDGDKICVRLDELRPCFSMKLVRGEPEFLESYSVVCVLQPKEEIAFNISFEASQPGEYTAILPVYLQSDQSETMHNYIHLVGIYPQPTMTCEEDILYFKPSILKVTTTTVIILRMAFHLEDCRLQATTNVNDLYLKIRDEYISKNKQGAAFDVKVEAIFTPRNSTAFQSTIDFTCTCGIIYLLPIVGASENCYITNHAFFQTFVVQKLTKSCFLSSFQSIESGVMQTDVDVNSELLNEKVCMSDFFPSYPAFPPDSASFAVYMKAVIRVAESWVYMQGFFGTHSYGIPDGIKLIPQPDKKNGQKYWIMPFAQLLINLVGNDMITYLELAPPPPTFDAQVMYCYSVYKQALIFLKELGAVLPHVYPELLLNYLYFEHCVTKYKTVYNGTVMDSKSFHFISKQMWLDLILQTYKVLTLQQIKLTPLSKTQQNSTPAEIFTMHKLSDTKSNRVWSEYVYTPSEIMLLQWLEFNYNLMAKQSWTRNKFLEPREVNSFEDNLDDGLVFIAVTTIYCPYLIPRMQDIYFQPSSFEQNFHNAIKVTECWEELNFSFCVSPQELVKTNAVQMLMLSSYLFEVLPSLYPQETMSFKAGLSQSTTKIIKLSNINYFPIGYKVVFFNNEEECFSANRLFVTIQPGKTTGIEIQYKALFARIMTVNMVLSGECSGLHYCKSKAITLTGEPDVTYMTSTLTFPTYLYKPTEVSLTCVSPYRIQGTYQIFLTYDAPQNLEDIFITPDFNNFSNILNKRFHPYKTQQIFNEEGICKLEGLMCGMLPIDRSILCYFHSKDIGDFAVRINTVLRPARIREDLNVFLPRQCKIHKSLVLKIPNQNTILWKAFETILMKVKSGSEKLFWKNHLSEASTKRLVLYFLSQDKGHTYIEESQFDKTKYNIKVPKTSELILPESIYIEDECGSGYQEIPIKLKEGCSYPSTFLLSLESENHRQFRYYTVKFITN